MVGPEAGRLLLMLLGLWAMAAAAAILHHFSRRPARQALRILLGGLIGAGIWRAGLYRMFITNLTLNVGTASIILPMAPRVLSPVLYFAVLIVYISEGTVSAAILIIGLFGVALLVSALSPLSILVAGAIDNDSLSALELLLPIMSWRQHLAQFSAFVIGIYLMLMAYQWLANRLPRRLAWVAGALAIFLAGLMEGGLFVFGGFWAEPDWPNLMAAEIAGWVSVGLAMTLPVGLYMRYLLAEGSAPGRTHRRPPLDVLRTTFTLQSSMEQLEERAARLDVNLHLLTEVRKLILWARTREDLMRGVCETIAGVTPYRLIWMAAPEEGGTGVQPVASAGQGTGFIKAVHPASGEEQVEAVRTAMREDRTVVVDRIDADPGHARVRAAALARGFHSMAAIPIRLGDRQFGVLLVYADQPGAFSAPEVRTLEAVADDLAHGVNRLLSEKQRTQRIEELDVVREMTAEMISEHDLPVLLESIIGKATEMLGGTGGGMFLTDPVRREVRCVVSYQTRRDYTGLVRSYGDGIAGAVAETGKPVLLEDMATRQDRLFESEEGSLISVPMVWQGRVTGVINLVRDTGPAFTPENLELLSLFANQAAMVLENAKLIDDAQRRVKQLARLNELTRSALSTHDLQALVQNLAEQMGALIDSDTCFITLWDESRRTPMLAAAAGRRRAELEALYAQLRPQPGERTLTQSVLEAGRPLVINDISQIDDLRSRLGQELPSYGLLLLPLVLGDARLGAAGYGFAGGHAFTEEEIALCEQAAGQVSLALANLKAYDAERRRRSELETLRQAGLKLTSSLEMPSILEAILENTLELTQADDAHIFLFDGETVSFGSARWAGSVQKEPYADPRPHGLTYTVARTGRRIVIDDASTHELYADSPWRGSIVGLPLRAANRVVGVMNVAYQKPHAFEADEIAVLELLADQAAITIDNARLYAAAVGERRRLHLLYEVARELGSTLDKDAILQRAIERMVENLGGLFGAVVLTEEGTDRLHLRSVAGQTPGDLGLAATPRDLRVGRGLIGWVAEQRQPVLVSDVSTDERWIPSPGFDDRVRSILCAPILLGERLLGLLAITHSQASAFGEEHLDLLQAVSGQVGLALSNVEQYQQVERRLAELGAIQQVAQVINRRVELQPLLDDVVQQVKAVLGYPLVNIDLVEGDRLVLRAAAGVEEVSDVELDLTEGVVGRVARTNKPAFVPDVTQDHDFVELVPGVRSEIAVPLRKAGVVIGVLNVESREPGGLTRDDLRLLTLLADQVSVAIENAALYDRLRQYTEDLERTVAERTSDLAKALEQAQQADRLKTQFVSDVSHELRTPLSNIRLYLDLLGQGRPERFEEYLKTLERESTRLVTLIEDLLAISRFDAGTLPVDKVPLDLNTLALSLVEDRQRLFAERRIELSFSPEKPLPLVGADHRLLSQVIANLMTNAMHYTLAGGKVHISTRTEETDGQSWVSLSVSDTGAGIPAEEQPRLFERFFRGSASRAMRNPGTGLGLAICKEILERHEGAITLTSKVGEGSTFTFRLPPLSPDERPEPSSARRLKREPQGLANPSER